MTLRWNQGFLLVAACLATGGCGRDSDADEMKKKGPKIEIAEVPKSVMDVAQKRLPNVKFTEAWKNVHKKTGKLHSYEIRGKLPATGKPKEVCIDPEGKVLEEE